MDFKGAIFDLDGIVVDTVPIHFKAWKKMFKEYGKDFTFDEYKKKVDGIPRIDGAKAILTDFSDEDIKIACNKKQAYFLEYLQTNNIPIYKTTIDLIRQLKEKGIKIAIISSSKNCPLILEKINLYPYIDVEINGNHINKGKPDPEIFLIALEKLSLKNKECIVFEDALLGVVAAKNAGIVCVGVDRHNDPERLKNADIIVRDLSEIDYHKLKSLLDKTHQNLN